MISPLTSNSSNRMMGPPSSASHCHPGGGEPSSYRDRIMSTPSGDLRNLRLQSCSNLLGVDSPVTTRSASKAEAAAMAPPGGATPSRGARYNICSTCTLALVHYFMNSLENSPLNDPSFPDCFPWPLHPRPPPAPTAEAEPPASPGPSRREATGASSSRRDRRPGRLSPGEPPSSSLRGLWERRGVSEELRRE